MKDHKNTCTSIEKKCLDCGVSLKENTDEIHDCLTSLVAALDKINVEKIVIENRHGVNYNKVNIKCDNGHQMLVQRGLIRGKYSNNNRNNDEYNCKRCDQRNLMLQDLYYRCSECDLNVCRMCTLQECTPPVLNKNMKFFWHDCVMTSHDSNRNSGWRCDLS
jgi:hypothetical protein